jgi:hypothetical protein
VQERCEVADDALIPAVEFATFVTRMPINRIAACRWGKMPTTRNQRRRISLFSCSSGLVELIRTWCEAA